MITVNTQSFEQALRQYLKVSRSTVSSILNRRGFFMALKAFKKTPVVERSEIKVDVGTRAKPRALAYKIFNSRRRGGKKLSRAEVKEQVGRMVAARLRSSGSERAGWIHAIRRLARAAGMQARVRGPRIKQRSEASPARRADNNLRAECSWVYRFQSQRRGGMRHISPRVERAMAQAFSEEVAGMRAEIHKRMQRDANMVNAR